MHEVRYSKPLDSHRLKARLNKRSSIAAAEAFSRAIKPGAEMVECPICSSHGRTPLASIYGFTYVECSGCRSAYVSNPPSEADISQAYRSPYYTAANKTLLANPATIAYRLDQVARPKVAFVLEHCKQAASSWLDLGCGVGEMLAAARERDFETVGIETNEMEAEFARSHFGLSVLKSYITPENLDEFSGRFDIVSLVSVLEHVPDPKSLLSTISRIQRTGDTLVIETPHFPSLSAFSQMAAPQLVNRMMHPPLHLFLFSLKAIELILGQSGYQIKARWMFGQDFYELLSTLELQVPIADSALSTALRNMTNEFQSVIDRNGFSDEMLLVAERMD